MTDVVNSTRPDAADLSRRRFAGWCLAIAAAGTPSTVLVIVWGSGTAAAAAATAIGSITVAAFTAARAFLRADATGKDPS